jgi:hypothetical protein
MPATGGARTLDLVWQFLLHEQATIPCAQIIRVRSEDLPVVYFFGIEAGTHLPHTSVVEFTRRARDFGFSLQPWGSLSRKKPAVNNRESATLY